MSADKSPLSEAVERLRAAAYRDDLGPANGVQVWVRDLRTLLAVLSEPQASSSLQARVKPWMDACFGPEISADRVERNDRFLEEALELVQASGYTRERVALLVDYVYDRPQGEINQEVGGVMITLAAHCLAHGVDMHEAGETELARIWTKVEQIRAKQAAKPKHSPLPQAAQPLPVPKGEEEIARLIDPAAWDAKDNCSCDLDSVRITPSSRKAGTAIKQSIAKARTIRALILSQTPREAGE